MDFLTNILANLFDKFKAKSPKVAGLIILILTMLIAGLETQYAQELLGESAQRISQVVLFVWVALQGSRTSGLLEKEKTKK
mgnify:CR=1 FL=1|jgi:hypothetical protein